MIAVAVFSAKIKGHSRGTWPPYFREFILLYQLKTSACRIISKGEKNRKVVRLWTTGDTPSLDDRIAVRAEEVMWAGKCLASPDLVVTADQAEAEALRIDWLRVNNDGDWCTAEH